MANHGAAAIYQLTLCSDIKYARIRLVSLAQRTYFNRRIFIFLNILPFLFDTLI